MVGSPWKEGEIRLEVHKCFLPLPDSDSEALLAQTLLKIKGKEE